MPESPPVRPELTEDELDFLADLIIDVYLELAGCQPLPSGVMVRTELEPPGER